MTYYNSIQKYWLCKFGKDRLVTNLHFTQEQVRKLTPITLPYFSLYWLCNQLSFRLYV